MNRLDELAERWAFEASAHRSGRRRRAAALKSRQRKRAALMYGALCVYAAWPALAAVLHVGI